MLVVVPGRDEDEALVACSSSDMLGPCWLSDCLLNVVTCEIGGAGWLGVGAIEACMTVDVGGESEVGVVILIGVVVEWVLASESMETCTD